MIPVVADADTLFGATTRGLLIHLDHEGAIHCTGARSSSKR